MPDDGPWTKFAATSATSPAAPAAAVVAGPWTKFSQPPPASPEKVYYNDAGQPFTASGAPAPQPKPAASYTGSILPLSRDASGLHLAVPESIVAPVRGAIEGGERALGVGEAGRNPLRPLNPDEMSAAAAFGGIPLRAGADAAATPKLPASGVSPERAALAKEARETFKIPVTAPQIGMSRTGKFADAAVRGMPLSGAREHEMAAQQAFNRAVSQAFGEDAPAITQSVMDQAKRRIGGAMNAIEGKNHVTLDDQFLTDLARVEKTTHESVTAQEYSVIKNQLSGALQNIERGDTIGGLTYGNLLHHGSPLDRAASNSNPNVAWPAQQIKLALQDALERSLSGDDLAAYQKARFQYKNMKTIEPLVNKSPQGDISPALLNGRVSSQFPNRAYDVGGKNPLDRLAKIGQAFLKEPGSSGSAERGGAMYGLTKAGELAGAVAAGDIFGIPATIGGAAATLGASRLVGKALRSPKLADRTIGRALRRPSPKPAAVLPGAYLYRATSGAALGRNGDTADEMLGNMP